MPTVLRKTSLLLAVCLALTGSADINTATAQTKPATTRPESNQAETDSQDTSDTADDELETAAVSLDLSHSSPLIQKLYQATRETKEQDILARLSEAKKLLADKANVKSVFYRIDTDAIVIAEVFAKKSAKTPKAVLETCRRRLKEYDHAGK